MTTIKPKTKEALLQVAEWQLGVTESPVNRVKYNDDYYGKPVSGSAYPWCMVFVWWCFHEAGFNLTKTASCTTLANSYKKAGQWVTSGFKPGDIVMYDFSGKKSKTEHTGIVEQVNPDGSVIAIEGNTSTGNNSNGGCVMRRVRQARYITGACRPGFNM